MLNIKWNSDSYSFINIYSLNKQCLVLYTLWNLFTDIIVNLNPLMNCNNTSSYMMNKKYFTTIYSYYPLPMSYTSRDHQ